MKICKLLGAASFALLSFSIAVAQEPVAQDAEPGSFLVFPQFDIRAGSSTQLRVTNILDLQAVNVKLNYVCPGVKNVNQLCAALNRTVTLTPHGSAIIDVATQNPPCAQGFVVAFAQDPKKLTPWSYNYLIGSYFITRGGPTEAGNAIAFQSPKRFKAKLGTSSGFKFGGTGRDYQAYGTELYTDFSSVDPADGVGANLILLTLDTLAGQQNPPTNVAIDFWSSTETPFSTSLEYICWTAVALDEIDANFLSDNMETFHGSMGIVASPTCPLPGLCPPIPNFDPVILGALEETGDGVLNIRNLLHDDSAKGTTYLPR